MLSEILFFWRDSVIIHTVATDRPHEACYTSGDAKKTSGTQGSCLDVTDYVISGAKFEVQIGIYEWKKCRRAMYVFLACTYVISGHIKI